MGLIRAAFNALTGNLSDQYKEYICCDALSSEVLAARGHKRLRSGGTNKGSDYVITDGSVIAVNEGQCALIVADGKVTEAAAEAGVFIFKSSESPSVFSGELGDSIMKAIADIGSRITFGGQAGHDQRVYYINIKEITGNRYGTASPIPFRVVDGNIGLDVDVGLRCNGEYSYRITNPVLFYTNVCGNFGETYNKSNLDSMLKSEILTALQPALGRFSEQGMRPSMLPSHAMELCDSLNSVLSGKWGNLRGMQVTSFNINSVTLSEEDQNMLTELQKRAVMRDPTMAAASLASAQADAMRTAAGNSGGAMMGFMGMNMAQQQGGFNAQDLYRMGNAQNNNSSRAASFGGTQTVVKGWKCSCGTENTGKFCSQCGKPKPDENFWTCSCGHKNKGRFCQECGRPKPAGLPLYKCDKCGWEPDDPKNPPKFCPECGDPFDADDIV